MRVVLIDGCEEYSAPSARLLLGFPTEVPDEIANRLISVTCPTGPMIIQEANLDPHRVSLQLVDRRRPQRNGGIYAEGSQPIRVSTSIAPYLLRLKRGDGSPIYEEVDDEA